MGRPGEAEPGERDHREATIAGADVIVVHYVSTPAVRSVTAVERITAQHRNPAVSRPRYARMFPRW
ncbi:hypothetical protein ACIP88_00210 [Streptomyces uncialis]|uniref:hypothetical protein n=1 Tax=Streptomyces uncialis TaxID=1048205 RepID=UPI00381A4251